MCMYNNICVIMCNYNCHMSRKIQYNCIQLSAGKLLDAMKTDTGQSITKYKTKKNINNNDINISNNNDVITVSYKYAMII